MYYGVILGNYKYVNRTDGGIHAKEDMTVGPTGQKWLFKEGRKVEGLLRYLSTSEA